MTLRVLCAIGTRPEAIKMAPVIRALEAHPAFTPRVLFTGQHRQLLDQVATFFGIRADVDLAVMQAGQTLPSLTARIIERIDQVLADEAPDVVLAQGDTTTVMATALGCYYRRIPFGHVEAGLRTDDKFSPFPEEANRRLATVLTDFHFAPTERSAHNLRAEGVAEDRIFVTGNTVVDALQSLQGQALPWPAGVPTPSPERRLALVTLHRRESFGAPLLGVLNALVELSERFPDLELVYPVHPNPQVQGPAHNILGGRSRIHLIEPLGYGEFMALMRACTLLLSDSGGVQEEAPSLGVPLLVLRETTERPEGVEAGVAKLVGTDPKRLLAEASVLLSSPEARAAMRGANPYGDGQAAARIVDVLAKALA